MNFCSDWLTSHLLDPFKMVKVLWNNLQTVLAQVVARQIHTSDSLYPQQRLNLFSALLPYPVATQVDHLQATHLHNSADELTKRVFGKTLSRNSCTLSLKPDRSMSSIIWNLLEGEKEVRGNLV
jgi:hypothetical protein